MLELLKDLHDVSCRADLPNHIKPELDRLVERLNMIIQDTPTDRIEHEIETAREVNFDANGDFRGYCTVEGFLRENKGRV